MSAEAAQETNVYSISPPKASNMIAVASGKGGVGKTFVSSTLAHALSKEGKRVLLFDGDLGLANVDVQLGLMPEHDLGSVIAGYAKLEEAICRYGAEGEPLLTPPPPGSFDILAGKSGSGALISLSAGQLRMISKALHALARAYDIVIIDLPAGIDPAVIQLSQICQSAYVVLTDEPTSLTDAYAYIKVIARSDPQADFQVIVNQADSKPEGEKTFLSLAQACQTFLDIKLTHMGTVRRDKKVKEAIRHQMPILKRHPDASAGQDLTAIARKMMA